MRLQDKVAVVTGGASGFGAGIVRKFAEEGARVVVADLNVNGAHEIAAEVKGLGIQVDVADGASVAAMVDATLGAYGRLDILVNNAGITHYPAPLEEVTEQDFDKVFAVNCKSVFLTAQNIVPVMKKQGQGAILNVASTAGVSPRPRLNWYNASKGWMNTATKAMAVELAPQGIRVNAINPVAGETPLLKVFMGEDTPEIRAKFLSTIPIGRFSTPSDMGNAACFLCSDEASMVTGVCMEVDEVTTRMTEAYGALIAAPALEDKHVGPLVSHRQKSIVNSFLERGADLTIAAQGVISDSAPDTGAYVAPTLFADVAPDHSLAQDEIFGPVQVIIPFQDENEAIAIANGTDYGLVASCWSRDGARQMRMAKKLRAGQVFVNNYGAGGGVELPFGGSGHSGHGREKGFEALFGFSTVKTVATYHG